MKAARLHAYHEALKLEEVDEPKALGPLDVVVRIGAAGLCRSVDARAGRVFADLAIAIADGASRTSLWSTAPCASRGRPTTRFGSAPGGWLLESLPSLSCRSRQCCWGPVRTRFHP